jgi:hypothetical protein
MSLNFFYECSKHEEDFFKKKIYQNLLIGNGGYYYYRKKKKDTVLITAEGRYVIPEKYSEEEHKKLDSFLFWYDCKNFINVFKSNKKKEKLYFLYNEILSSSIEEKNKKKYAEIITMMVFLKMNIKLDFDQDLEQITK